MISAAITPGIQPSTVRIRTIKIDPQPLSMTAKGGNRIDNKTLQILIMRYKDKIFFGMITPSVAA